MVAGGSGQRFGRPKQFESLSGPGSGETNPEASTVRVMDRSVAIAAGASDGVVVVVPPEVVDRERAGLESVRIRVVAGGRTRSESVRRGLDAVPDDATVICVHDAARPFAGPDLFAAVVAAVAGEATDGPPSRPDGAVPGVPVTDTIKVVDGDTVVETPDRSTLVAVQTPQAFRAEVLRAVHAADADDADADADAERPAANPAPVATSATDDASMVEAAGGRVVVVPGDPGNVKITRPEDLDRARERVAGERRHERTAP